MLLYSKVLLIWMQLLSCADIGTVEVFFFDVTINETTADLTVVYKLKII